MKKDSEILESLILGGLIGAALGALVSNSKNESTTIGAIAGAAILASFKASERAKASNIPLYVKEGEMLFEINANGDKKFIKHIEKVNRVIPKKFKLDF